MSWGDRLRARDEAARAVEGAEAPISVRPIGSRAFAVFRGETCISGSNHQVIAEMMAEGLRRGLATQVRRCLCCGTDFESEGPGHRMCGSCRAGRRLPSAQFEGW